MCDEEEATLIRRWTHIQQLDRCCRSSPSHWLRLKEEWFSDAFAFISTLSTSSHLWCAHGRLVFPLLEPFHAWPDSLLVLLRDRLFIHHAACFTCVLSYWQVKHFYTSEYPHHLVQHLLRLLHRLDVHRVVSHLSRLCHTLRPFTTHDSSVLLEVLTFPSLLQHALVQKALLLLLRYARTQIPSLVQLVRLDSQGFEQRVGANLSAVRGVERLEPISSLMQALASSSEQAVNKGGSFQHKRRVASSNGCEKRSKSKVEDLRARLPPPAQLHGLYKRLLALDVLNLCCTSLKTVPLQFESYRAYVEVFRPLWFEELRSQLKNAVERNFGCTGVMHQRGNLESDDDCFFSARFSGDDRGAAENDILLVADNPPGTTSKGLYLLAKVDKAQRGNSPMLLHFYFGEAEEGRLSKARSRLCTEAGRWYVTKLVGLTPFLREIQALLAMRSLPHFSTILNPARQPAQPFHVPPGLWERLKADYNHSQLNAITSAIDNGVCLVQGPPGTGKTRTILALISTMLSPAQDGEGDVDLWKDWSDDSTPSARVLVCAQSNGAVDELVSRICVAGLHDSAGEPYRPSFVRVGDMKKVTHSTALSVHLDTLVSARISGPGESSLDLRTEFKELDQEMQVHFDEAGSSDKLTKFHERHRNLHARLLKAREREELHSGHNLGLQLDILRKAQVVLSTISGCGGKTYSLLMDSISKDEARAPELLFDAVIVDEAAQAVEPCTLIPLQLLKSTGRFILVGDPKQLPATLHSDTASAHGYDMSMFERFQRNGYPVTMLDTQYRMHPEIVMFPSTHFYNNQLIDGVTIRERRASFHEYQHFRPYMFFDVPGGRECCHATNGSIFNPVEVELVFQILRGLKQRYPNENLDGRIAVLTPYKEQMKALKMKFDQWPKRNTLPSRIDFCTVDSFQGREVDVLILSTVRSQGHVEAKTIGFLKDVRRMNVALTRARYALWIVGDSNTLSQSEDWAALVHNARSRGLLTVCSPPFVKYFS